MHCLKAHSKPVMLFYHILERPEDLRLAEERLNLNEGVSKEKLTEWREKARGIDDELRILRMPQRLSELDLSELDPEIREQLK